MIGRVFLGRYETTRLLGEGGMGRVFLARQNDLGRQVVVKVMHDTIAADPKFRERFKRETLLMARFQHPNAVTLYDASLDDPLGPCIIMEYVKGTNLDVVLAKNQRITPTRVGRLLHQLCDVLQEAHEAGIIHRDLKPANLMILDADTPKEKVKVMDFGLAKMIDASELKKVTDTKVDFAVGTPGYICPEQIRGDTVDHRGDLYSVGVILYQLLSGRLPFEGLSSMDLLLAHATEQPPTFAELDLDPTISKAVEDVIMRCLAKDPADRPQSARELDKEYDAALHAAADRPKEQPPEEGLPTTKILQNKAFATSYVTPEDDPNAIMFMMEAWMPETVALLKLRGFVHDAEGEVLESVPGRIRVRLMGRTVPTAKPTGPLAWLGLGKKPGPIIMELQLQPAEGGRETLLNVTVVFRPGDNTPATDSHWRSRCVQIYIDFRAYLIGLSDAN